MDLIITILPVVTKDLSISPRFTPYNFFIAMQVQLLLQLVNQWLNFTNSRSHAFRYERKNTNPTGKNRTHDFRTTSRCAAYLLDHSGDFTHFKPPYAIASVPSLSGRAKAYRWRSPPRVHRHRASKPLAKAVPNECCLGRSPWTNQYSPLFPTPTIGMKWLYHVESTGDNTTISGQF